MEGRSIPPAEDATSHEDDMRRQETDDANEPEPSFEFLFKIKKTIRFDV